MFLCEPCHKKGGCRTPTFIEAASRGRCENCGESAVCTDCHGYNFSDKTEAEIEKMITDMERGETYSYWLRTGDTSPWRQVDVTEYVEAERAAGFFNPRDHASLRPATGGFGAKDGTSGFSVPDSFEESEEAKQPGSFHDRWIYKGRQFVEAWRNRDPSKVETR